MKKIVQRARLCALLLASALLPLHKLHADAGRFDLTGPTIEMRVTRNGTTLPIAQVPNLLPGDKIWIHPDFPATQSVHLLVVVSFLRGTTNPPPDEWFTRIDAWNKKAIREGITIVVPADAESALLFIAPETGGDFSTLKSAVRGRPGVFVRAAADLSKASFEQSRIEHYLNAMKEVPQNDEAEIASHSAKLASTLALKPNPDCMKQPVDQQVACLRQTGDQMLLDDGHGQSIASTITNGASSDFINAAAGTQMAGAGIYSAYVGTVVDLVRLMSGLHTAQFQYIPAISFPQDQTLNLKLNTAPSFHNPKSVIVVGLPAIQKAKLPPLRPHDQHQVSCLLQPHMVLPLEGAPLVFATGYAHDMVLHIGPKDGGRDLPLVADAFEGGLIVDSTTRRRAMRFLDLQEKDTAHDADTSSTDLTVTGTIHGYWGFDPFDGPLVTLQQQPGSNWGVTGDTQLFAGMENHLSLKASGTACAENIQILGNGQGNHPMDIAFSPIHPVVPSSSHRDTLQLTVPLQRLDPGGYNLLIKQYGIEKVTTVPVTAYNNTIRLSSLMMHAGDRTAELSGSALKLVTSVKLGDATFTPTDDSDGDTLHLVTANPLTPSPQEKAQVILRDGRILTIPFVLKAARPTVQLLSVSTMPDSTSGSLPVVLTDKEDIPVAGKLTFVVQSEHKFLRNQTIEIATTDDSLHTTLSIHDGSLVLQDSHTAIGTLFPLKTFGTSAFGKLQFRPVDESGTPGNWIPLGTLVRTPTIEQIHCDTGENGTCQFKGSAFFLIQSVAGTADFSNATDVATGYAETTLDTPLPADGATLYLKLRDDPDTQAIVKLSSPLTKHTKGKKDKDKEKETQEVPANPSNLAPESTAPIAPATTTPETTSAPDAQTQQKPK